MIRLNACEKKVQLWKSLPNPDEKDLSDEQWKMVFEHTRSCKQCLEEINKVTSWVEGEITNETVMEIYIEDILPQLLGIQPETTLSEKQKIIRLMIVKAISVVNIEQETAKARMKMNEYLLQKHYELRLPDLIEL